MGVVTRRLLIGVLLAIVLIAIAALPPRSCLESEPSAVWSMLCGGNFGRAPRGTDRPERLARFAILHELADRAMVTEVRGRLAARDRHSVTSGGTTVLFEAPLSTDSANSWLRAALAEQSRYATSAPRVRVVVELQTDSARLLLAKLGESPEQNITWESSPLARRVLGTDARGPLCVVAVDLASTHNTWGDDLIAGGTTPRGKFLDWCALVGGFGPPGGAVAAWAAPALSDGLRYGWSRTRSLSWAMDIVAQRGAGAELPPTDDLKAAACLRGSVDACMVYAGLVPVLMDPTTQMESGMRRRLLLAYLVQRDPARFQRFWNSEGSVPEALAEVYGEPADVVLREWVGALFRAPEAGPAAPRRVVAASLGWLIAALAVAFAVSTVRRAD